MDAPLSPVETIKAESRFLRGTLVESLADAVTGAIRDADTQVIKFHGSYQQDDRDVREERRRAKLEPAYSFMLRTRLPGGVATPAQWLALDAIARDYGNGTLRLTTRQAFQVHGVVKGDLKPTIQALDRALLDTIAACGDVNRNVLGTANPEQSALHADVYAWSVRLSEHLLPKTGAYREIWLDGEKVAGDEEEPILGATYLPRKFKAAIAVPPLNDVDVFAQDLSFIAIVEDDEPRSGRAHGPRLAGFDVAVGGGMGATHGEKATFPRLADVIGFVTPDELLDVATAVVTTQRDFGDRTNRKHARLKYTIEDRGIAWFVAEVERRLGRRLAPARPFRFEHHGDRFGWVQNGDGRAHLTLRIEAGRIADRGAARHLAGLKAIAMVHDGTFRLTPNQNLIVAGVPADKRAKVDALVREYGLDLHERASPVRLNALACVALPTCPLAMAEAERYLPDFVERVEALLERHALAGLPLDVRITGCPNGCARPYLAEIGLVGKAPGRYNLHLGGDAAGARLNALHRENIDEQEILATLDALFARFGAEARPRAERFGDWVVRAGVVAPPPQVTSIPGESAPQAGARLSKGAAA